MRRFRKRRWHQWQSSGPDKPSVQLLPTVLLIGQNRMAAAADKRADLDLTIRLLAEQEVTRLVTLVSGIIDRMGVKTEADARAASSSAATGWLPPRFQGACPGLMAGRARPDQLPGNER